MKLPISQLREGDNSLTYESSNDGWLKEVIQKVNKEGVQIQGDLKFEGQMTKLEPDFYLKGRLNFVLKQPCARCAETISEPIRYSFDMAFVHAPEGPARKATLSEESEELDLILFTSNDIDLAPVVEEQVLLSVPFRSLCREDCKGICQRCGKNLNQGNCDCKDIDDFSPFSILNNLKS